MNTAKDIFFKYYGSYFYMQRDGQLTKYLSYNIDKNTEKMWGREYEEELIEKIRKGTSVDDYMFILYNLMIEIGDYECLVHFFTILEEVLEQSDSFIKILIAESLQKIIKNFMRNNIGDRKKLDDYRNITINIFRDVTTQPIVLSEETRKKTFAFDVLSEENLRKRAKEGIKEFT